MEHLNPTTDPSREDDAHLVTLALQGSTRDYRGPVGHDLFGRVQPFADWVDLRRLHGFWPYSKTAESAAGATAVARWDDGTVVQGTNLASQDYLGLSRHPAVLAAAREAMERFGLHSAGSSALFGNTSNGAALEQALSTLLLTEHVLLYPTGWAAGYGTIRGLLGPADHVVIDALAHACLQEGARGATRHVYLHRHLEVDGVRHLLARIRAKDADNAILVVTEGLFSMDSDTPRLRELQEVASEYRAFLMVDVAHDLGCLGPFGGGHLALQQMLGKVDIVMGSFSKTFASNGGFVATRSPHVRQFLKFFSGPQTFSNSLSPVQAATVLACLEIVRSDEGSRLRDRLMDNVLHLRGALVRNGL